MAGRRVGSVFTSSIFTLGLIVIIVVLLFNYWTLLTRNGTVIREAHKLRLELQQATLSNNQSAKKLEGCKLDFSRHETRITELNEIVKNKETSFAETSEQLKQAKNLYSSLLEEKNALARSLTEAQNEKTRVMTSLEEEKKKCQENVKTLAKECLEVCDTKVNEARKEVEQKCQERLQQQKQQNIVDKKVTVAVTNSTK